MVVNLRGIILGALNLYQLMKGVHKIPKLQPDPKLLIKIRSKATKQKSELTQTNRICIENRPLSSHLSNVEDELQFYRLENDAECYRVCANEPNMVVSCIPTRNDPVEVPLAHLIESSLCFEVCNSGESNHVSTSHVKRQGKKDTLFNGSTIHLKLECVNVVGIVFL